ncbi:endonuclease domain-containing protein [Methylopila turkensis]|uniref:DUF559 domain-containing protein n=1 Tax=Methylopila turkensis TaxID=1437816 RepID=A0A9W6N7V9_9HYPH|nr:DUF559 domain-containing protein [Methylopila turkensis]GLK80801.1 hypothetical protein GCM10008174_25420 [Methylopila turkensis]
MSVERARELRKSMTRQEVKLWVRLRELRGLGFHPRRQAPLLGYIVDFAFKSERIVIEIDGGQHAEGLGAMRDRTRHEALNAVGYSVLRFWNVDVDRNLDGVVEEILNALRERAGGL